MATYLTEGRYTVDEETRAQLYADAQTWMYENIRQVAFAEPAYSYCWRPYISSDFWCSHPEVPILRWVTFAE